MYRWIVLALLPASLFAQDLTGTWQGVVKNPDTQQELRTVIKIASSSETPIKGNFYSIDQTYLVFPATITVQGSTVKMNIPGIGATYDAKLSADGNSIAGTVKGFSVPAAWAMKRISNPKEAWALPKPPTPSKPMAADADPAFEVATVKLTRPDAGGGRGGNAGGSRVQNETFTAVNVTLVDLVKNLYDLHGHQVIGLPAWASSEHYDITGRPDKEGQPSQDQWKIMLRKLLADRFQLKFHKEQRELPVYTLSPAKSGVKISKNETKSETSGVIFRGPGSVLLNNLTMDEFCRMLQSSVVDRPVVNQTGLIGKYEFSLVWTPEQAQVAIANTNALAPGADPPPDLFVAVQQQLGLKLDATKQKIEVYVIDKVEKPSEN